jgi:cobalt transporter subunit CbtA
LISGEYLMLFRKIVIHALLIGFIAGLTLTVAQIWRVIPIIKVAETYEIKPALTAIGDLTVYDHSSSEHVHDVNAWEPQDGLERTSYTLLSNLLIAFGFALFVLVIMIARDSGNSSSGLNWKSGLLWSAAGYCIFFLAPSLGMPPEIPGSASAPLEARQMWWLITVLCTAGGLAGFAFNRSNWRWGSLGLLLVPHLLGAPRPLLDQFANQPAETAAQLAVLSEQFIASTAIANAAFWIALGLVAVWSAQRIKSKTDESL